MNKLYLSADNIVMTDVQQRSSRDPAGGKPGMAGVYAFGY